MASSGATLRGGAESTGGWCARTTPSGTAQRDSPPAHFGIQLLGKDDVVHVLVIVQLELQQSLTNDSGMVPQSQFLDRVPDIPIELQR